MRNYRNNNFVKILKNDASTVFLTAGVSFYLALVTCLPFNASIFTITIINIGFIFLLSLAYQYIKNFSLKPTNEAPISFWYFFIINLGILSIYFYATYPGCMIADVFCQWSQVQKGEFSDWHPALHSMILWCFSRICNKPQFVLAIQLIIFSLVNSSLYYEISKLGLSKKLLKPAFFLTILSPATCTLLMILLKDVSFAISIVGLTEIFLLTYFSNGKWIQTNFRTVLLGVLLSLTSIFRHNGILYTIPFAVVFIYLFRNKHVLRACIIAICLTAFIKIPFYSYLKVSPHPQAQAELCGLPMTVLTEIFVKNPSVLDKETTDFMLSIADYDTWKSHYKTGSWNSAKFSILDSQQNCNVPTNQKIMEFTPKKLCIKAFKHGIKDPSNTLNALINLSKLVWKLSFFSDDLVKIYPLTTENASKYTGKATYSENTYHDSALKGIFQLSIIAYSIIFSFFWRPGLYLLLLILSAFFSFHRLRWKSFLIITPTLIYNLGTMVLLCGYNDFRFFFFEVLITFPYMFILFSKKPQKSTLP